MLSITGNWYEEDLQQINSHHKFGALSSDILTEYRLERDKHEVGGQSPNDLSHDGHEILEGLKSSFNEIQIQPFFSFIYRFLGGLRGDDETVKKLADLLVLFDTYATSNKLMNPNYFLFAGAKK
jgi:diphthamide synthase subunit DPH2